MWTNLRTKKIELNVLLGYIILLLVTVSTSIVAIYIINRIKSLQPPPPEVIEKPVVVEVEPKPKPSDYPDYDAIKGKNPDPKIKSVIITKDCPENGCINQKPATVDFNGIDKKYQVKGKFSRAYLFIDALVDYERPLTVWDDFYFTVDNYGGHLIPDENALPIPPGSSSRYLYDLRSISYYPSIKDKEKQINKQINKNLFNLLMDGDTISITASISSDRPGRVMKEVSIYYECFEGSNCSIEEVK